jgi:hypothetical protein
MQVRVYEVHEAHGINESALIVVKIRGEDNTETHEFPNLQDASGFLKKVMMENHGLRDITLCAEPECDFECLKEGFIRMCDALDREKKKMLWILLVHSGPMPPAVS